MSAKNKLKHSLITLLKKDNGGSFVTRYDRKRVLLQFCETLHVCGYKLFDIQGLKLKHISAVIAYWQQKSLSASTIKNRLSCLRQLVHFIHKPELLPSNETLGVKPRRYVTRTNRAIINPDFSKITHPHIKLSLELQRVFGLRREESLKIKPYLADKGDLLELSPSWCKGGRGRRIPIRTEEQRYWLEQAKALVSRADYSLIPQNTNYIRHRYVYDKQVMRAGLKNLHGLRHAYAQSRYHELTGWLAPICGGLRSRDYTKEQKATDYEARMVLTEELGHSREQITVNYCGR